MPVTSALLVVLSHMVLWGLPGHIILCWIFQPHPPFPSDPHSSASLLLPLLPYRENQAARFGQCWPSLSMLFMVITVASLSCPWGWGRSWEGFRPLVLREDLQVNEFLPSLIKHPQIQVNSRPRWFHLMNSTKHLWKK